MLQIRIVHCYDTQTKKIISDSSCRVSPVCNFMSLARHSSLINMLLWTSSLTGTAEIDITCIICCKLEFFTVYLSKPYFDVMKFNELQVAEQLPWRDRSAHVRTITLSLLMALWKNLINLLCSCISTGRSSQMNESKIL